MGTFTEFVLFRDLFQFGEMQDVGPESLHLLRVSSLEVFILCVFFSLNEFLLMLVLDYILALKGEK